MTLRYYLLGGTPETARETQEVDLETWAYAMERGLRRRVKHTEYHDHIVSTVLLPIGDPLDTDMRPVFETAIFHPTQPTRIFGHAATFAGAEAMHEEALNGLRRDFPHEGVEP